MSNIFEQFKAKNLGIEKYYFSTNSAALEHSHQKASKPTQSFIHEANIFNNLLLKWQLHQFGPGQIATLLGLLNV